MAHVLVVGASGNVGSEVVRLLREQGHAVRTTTSKAPRGDDQVQVDLGSSKGIQKAFDGMERAFLMSPGGYADQFAVLAPMIREAKRQGLKKVVLMSAMGADANDAAPLRKAEIELERSGLEYNIIRPNWFMQNFMTFWIQGILEQGKILLPARNAKVSFIDTRDIAAVAAKLLTSDSTPNRAFNLTGPEAISHEQVAETISRVSGRNVVYQEIEPTVLRDGLLGAGLSGDYVEFLLLIMSYLAEGYNAAVTDDVKRIIGRDPIPFGRFATDHKGAWVN